MNTRLFFSLSLALPLVAAGLGELVSVFDFFIYFLMIAGLPYVVVALVALTLIWRLRSLRQMAVLSLLAPVGFALTLAAFIGVVGRVPEIDRTWANTISNLFEAAALGATFAFGYVGIAWALWRLALKIGIVRNEFASDAPASDS